MAPLNTSHYAPTPTPTSSPWGPIQDAEELGAGVWSVATASHGGISLSPQRNLEVPDLIRDASGWYEEDCDWATVAIVFPDLFTHDQVNHAWWTFRSYSPDAYEALTDKTLTPGESRGRDEANWWRSHQDSLVVRSAFGDWAAWVPHGQVGVIASIGGRGADGRKSAPERYFLLSAGDYAVPDGFGFVIDPTRHHEIPAPVNIHARKERHAA